MRLVIRIDGIDEQIGLRIQRRGHRHIVVAAHRITRVAVGIVNDVFALEILILKILRHYRSSGYELSIKIVFYGGSSDFEECALVIKSSYGPKHIEIQTEFNHCVPDGRTDYENAQYMFVRNIIRKLAEEFFTEERKCEFAEFKCSDEVWDAVVEHIDRDTDLKDDEK